MTRVVWGRVGWENEGGRARDGPGKGNESPKNREGSDHHHALMELEKGSWALTKIRLKE